MNGAWILMALIPIVGIVLVIIALKSINTKKQAKEKKLEERVAKKVLKIPEDKVREFLQLTDRACIAVKKGGGNEQKYDLWNFLIDIFPEIRSGVWHYVQVEHKLIEIRQGADKEW